MIGTWLRLRSCRHTSMPLMPRQHHVEQHEVGPHDVEAVERLEAVGRHLDAEALAAQADRQRLDEARLVLDDEHGGALRCSRALDCLLVRRRMPTVASGMRRTNVEPSPSCDDTSTSPPWLVATWRTIDSPRPVPPVSRLRPLSTR